MGQPSWECSRANSLNFGFPNEPEASELPKGLVLGRDGSMHIRLTGSTPLGDVGSYTYSFRFLKVSDIHTIYWDLSGNPHGHPVVFLHGVQEEELHQVLKVIKDSSIPSFTNHSV